MSAAISDSNHLQHGDSKEIGPTDTAPRYSQLELDLISFSENTLATLLQKLFKLYWYHDMPKSHPHTVLYRADSFIFPSLSSIKSSRDPDQPYDIIRCVLPNSSSSYWPVAGTEFAQQIHVPPTINETRYDESQLNLEDILVDKLRKMFGDARNEIFEDGMDTAFSDNLNRIIEDYHEVAIRAIKKVIRMNDVNAEVVEEALRQVGNADDVRSRHSRLSLLEKELESSNPRIRDAASIGIEAMDDPRAIESLQKAISNEQCEQLRQNFQTVLMQLKDVQ